MIPLYEVEIEEWSQGNTNNFRMDSSWWQWIYSCLAAGVAVRPNVHAFRASVHEQLQNFWALNQLGVAQEEMFKRDLELEVKNAIQCDKSGKYIVSWPWKPQAQKNLALNKALCETRLCRKVRKMMPEEYTAYDNQFKTLLKEGHIELLPNDCVPQTFLLH